MKFNLEKLHQLAKPLPEKERQQMEHQIENQDWLLLSVKLAIRIRTLMASEGISQSELARRMGVSPAQVTKILSGQDNLGLKTISKVETALGHSLFEIEEESDYSKSVKNKKTRNETFPVFVKSKTVGKKVSTEFSTYNVLSHIAYS